ncbi:MAG: hypothetical protein KBF88_16855, partial [Polyangiaceae bacterium]|nr:hypothetical protein [Polyangiaceae bacterium]
MLANASRFGIGLRTLAAALSVTSISLLLASTHGCASREGCVAGDNGACVPIEACAKLRYTCDDPTLTLRLVGPGDRPEGLDALAANGDVLIGNARMRAVIDAINSPHYLTPSGGALLDLVPMSGGVQRADDELNHISQAVGILPGDAVRYHSLELLDERPNAVSVIARGRLDGRPDVTVVTRYEVRPCDPGVRIRTDVYHGGRETETFFLADALYWGDREQASFAPVVGRGFKHPGLDLLSIGDAFTEQPWIASRAERPEAAAYGEVSCRANNLSGFHSTTITATGLPRTVVMPGDSLSFERFVLVGEGPGMSGVANQVLLARGQLFGDASVELQFRVVRSDGTPLGPRDGVSLLFYRMEGEVKLPLNEAVPDPSGRILVRLPRGQSFNIEKHVSGRISGAPVPMAASQGDANLGDLVVESSRLVTVDVVDDSGKPTLSELVLTPTDDQLAKTADGGSLYGVFEVKHCNPYLGPPHGGSPACNRVLTDMSGHAEFHVPDGDYWM